MKTIYIREKRSGNYEFSNRAEATHKFKSKKTFKKWFDNCCGGYRGKLIKATYSRSQVYFGVFDFDDAWKKAKELF